MDSPSRRDPLAGIAACLLAALCGAAATAGTPQDPFTLTKPSGDGPFPAVVLMHDCSGLGPRSSAGPYRWATRLSLRGYVTIAPDSFTPRGRPKGVCTEAAGPRITYEMRADDAYAALAYLRTLPFVDPRRIAVMGGSHGGSTALAAIVDDEANAARGRAGFAAAIALYPRCGRGYGAWRVERTRRDGTPEESYSGTFKPLAPLLILIGARDDWTPAAPCEALVAAARSAGYPVEIKVYPDAHHAFDSPFRQRFLPERVNRNAPTGRGATTGGNAEAWADAVVRVERFLARHLAK